MLRIIFLYCHQLINGIKALLLDSGAAVKLFFRNDLIYILIHSLSAAVTVSIGFSQYLILFIQKHIIHSPGVNSHRYRDLSQFLTSLHSCLDFLKQRIQIPAQASFPVLHAVFKAPDFLQDHFPVLYMPKHMTATGSSDVYGQIIAFHSPPPFTVSSHVLSWLYCT